MIRPKQPRKPLSQKKYVELKKYVFNRDGWCLQCGFSGTLTPAHIKRRSDGGQDAPNNLICLCIPCHTSFDKYEIELKKSIYEMLENEPDQF
jgi:5-methylcytosine-specific restriction endonuclease McrA